MNSEQDEIKKALKPFEININDRLTKLKMIGELCNNTNESNIDKATIFCTGKFALKILH